jgi:hypothetical protein
LGIEGENIVDKLQRAPDDGEEAPSRDHGGSEDLVADGLRRLHRDIARLAAREAKRTQASLRQQYLDGNLSEELYRLTEALLGEWAEEEGEPI